MGEILHEEGIEKITRNTVEIKNQICNQTCVKYIRTCLLELCRGQFSLEKLIYLLVLDILSFRLTHFSLVSQLTLYKFIVLCFLGRSPFLSGRVINLVLTVLISPNHAKYMFLY